MRSLAGLMAAAPYKSWHRQYIDIAKITCNNDQIRFNLRLKRIDVDGLQVEAERSSKNAQGSFVGEGVKIILNSHFVDEIFSSHLAPMELIKKKFPSSIGLLIDAAWDDDSFDLDGFANSNFFLKVSVHPDAASDGAYIPKFMLEYRGASSGLSTSVLDADRCRLAMTGGKSLIHEVLNDPADFGITEQMASEIKRSVEIHWPKMFSLVEAAMIATAVQTPSTSAATAPAKKNGRRI